MALHEKVVGHVSQLQIRLCMRIAPLMGFDMLFARRMAIVSWTCGTRPVKTTVIFESWERKTNVKAKITIL
jgi:hypothetical protein